MKALIRVIQAVLVLVWLALLGFSVLLCMSTRGNGLPGVSSWRGLVMADSRMAPELSPGDLAVVRMGASAQPGDVVLCRDSAGIPELTRIIGTTEGQLILKPDGSEESRLAGPEAIEGVFVGYLPGLGGPFRFLCSLAGVIAIAAAGLVLVVLPGFLLRSPRPEEEQREPGGPERPESPRRSRGGGYTPRH